MAYPMPLAYDDEKVDRMDFEYMKSLYPSAAKKVLPYVEDECDRLEYQCSMMYDEYPDKLQLRMMSGRIYDNVMKHEKMFYESGYEDVAEQLQMEKQQAPRPGRGEPAQNRPPQGTGRPNWLRDLIEVMLYQELYKRRCDNRRCRRRFY